MTSTVIACLDVKQSKDVTRQVEFYFSDINLPRDNFLSRTIGESEDGLVSLSLICSFSRMKKYLGLDFGVKPETVPEDKILAVAETLRKSSFLKISEDGKRVGRSTDLSKPEELIEQVDSRTISVSPLPYNVLLEDVESFFNQYGKVSSVRLPRHTADKRHFCGTALIEFSEEAVAQDALKQSLVYAGAELETKPKKEFESERAKVREEFEKSLSNNKFSNPRENYPKGLIVSFELKKVTGGEPIEDENHEMQLEDIGDGGGENSTPEAAPDNEKKDGDNLDKGNEQNFGKESDKGSAKEETQLNDKKNTITREDLKETIQRFETVNPHCPHTRSYEAPTRGSGWVNTFGGSYSDAGIPRDNGLAYVNAPSPYVPSTPGGQPMTPNTSSYLPGTPGGLSMTPGNIGLDVMSPNIGGKAEGNWLMPDVFVNIVRPGDEPHIGVVKEVLVDGSCKVGLGSTGNGETVIALPTELEMVHPKKSDKIKIMSGGLRGLMGKLIGIDGSDGIVKLDKTFEVKILDMAILAKLAVQ